MLTGHFQNIAISGMSVALPTDEVPVESFNERFGADVVKNFSEMVGIKKYHRARPEQTASDLAFAASKDVFEKQNIDPREIGILIFVTQKPDYRMPSTAALLHRRLELAENCIAFDINLACSGFIYGLHTISALLQNSAATKALLLTGDTSSRTMSPEDRTTIMLFGDSGTATLLEKKEGAPDIKTALRSDGKRFKSIVTPSGAYRNLDAPVERVEWSDGIRRSDYDTRMRGMDVFGFSITDVPRLLKEFMAELETTPDNYDCFALHQANLYILKQISRKVKVPMEKMPVAIDLYGNNSSNSVPLVLCHEFGAESEGSIHTMMSGFGAGLSWACADVYIDKAVMNPLIFTDEYYLEEVN